MKKSFIIICILVVGAIVFYGIRYMKTPVDTQVAAITKYEQTISANAFIVKKESVYQAENTGTFYNYISDGERVGKSSTIAAVYNGTVSADTLREINNIDKKIQEAAKDASKQNFITDAAGTGNQVDSVKDKIIQDAESRDVSKMSEYKESIANANSGENVKNSSNISELKSQKTKLENSIGKTKASIQATMSGIFTMNVDGLESTLTPETVMQYKVSDFDALVKPEIHPPKSEVGKGDSVCKVVDNHIWYAMFKTEADKLTGYETGSKVKMRFETIPGVEVAATIKYISEEENGQIVVVVECEHYVEGIFTVRNSDIELILASYTGYKVPVSAIRVDENNKTGVMIETRGTEVFRECEVLYTDKDKSYSIIYPPEGAQKSLQPMDKIVLGEKADGGEKK